MNKLFKSGIKRLIKNIQFYLIFIIYFKEIIKSNLNIFF